MAILKTIWNRKWWWTTLLVILGMIFLAQLGFWQLDRLQQRRDFNARLVERWDSQPFDVNNETIPTALEELEWRRVKVEGKFDYERQVLLTNQTREDGGTGVIFLTPLVMDENRAVLVARGWVPYDLASQEKWAQFDEVPNTPVVGLIQESQTNVDRPAQKEAQTDWYQIDIPAIQNQMPYELLSVFILQLPEPGRKADALPLREIPDYIQFPNEASHLSYAIQWFLFSVIFGFGYLQFVRTSDMRSARLKKLAAEGVMLEADPVAMGSQ